MLKASGLFWRNRIGGLIRGSLCSHRKHQRRKRQGGMSPIHAHLHFRCYEEIMLTLG
ncbi:Uncharacterised protein [Vibrio cholerae]|nr:Uncharacterised protein [Vibrio cholerae]